MEKVKRNIIERVAKNRSGQVVGKFKLEVEVFYHDPENFTAELNANAYLVFDELQDIEVDDLTD